MPVNPTRHTIPIIGLSETGKTHLFHLLNDPTFELGTSKIVNRTGASHKIYKTPIDCEIQYWDFGKSTTPHLINETLKKASSVLIVVNPLDEEWPRKLTSHLEKIKLPDNRSMFLIGIKFTALDEAAKNDFSTKARQFDFHEEAILVSAATKDNIPYLNGKIIETLSELTNSQAAGTAPSTAAITNTLYSGKQSLNDVLKTEVGKVDKGESIDVDAIIQAMLNASYEESVLEENEELLSLATSPRKGANQLSEFWSPLTENEHLIYEAESGGSTTPYQTNGRSFECQNDASNSILSHNDGQDTPEKRAKSTRSVKELFPNNDVKGGDTPEDELVDDAEGNTLELELVDDAEGNTLENGQPISAVIANSSSPLLPTLWLALSIALMLIALITAIYLILVVTQVFSGLALNSAMNQLWGTAGGILGYSAPETLFAQTAAAGGLSQTTVSAAVCGVGATLIGGLGFSLFQSTQCPPSPDDTLVGSNNSLT